MKKLFALMAAGLVTLGSPALSQDDLAFGKKTYKQFCSHCHGIDMVNAGTSSYDLRKWPKDDKERFYTSVTEGRGAMPAWGDILLPNEMDALWHYVITRGGKEPLAEAPKDTAPEAPIKNGTLEPNDLELNDKDTLTACLARNGGVMSSKRSGGGVGLDYALSDFLAAELDLDLEVVWFESEAEEDTSPAKDAMAQLAYGLCDIVPGFSLYAPILGDQTAARAAVPRWDEKSDILPARLYVDLQPIAVSDPYIRMEMGLVYRDGVTIGPISSLGDLADMHLGIEQGTLAGAVSLRQASAEVINRATTLNPGPSFLWELEKGTFDAALVTTGAYDFHRRQNAVSALRLHDYRHPLGFNLGVAMLADRTALHAAVNGAIAGLIAQGALEQAAQDAKLQYAKPRQPYIQAKITLRDIIDIR